MLHLLHTFLLFLSHRSYTQHQLSMEVKDTANSWPVAATAGVRVQTWWWCSMWE